MTNNVTQIEVRKTAPNKKYCKEDVYNSIRKCFQDTNEYVSSPRYKKWSTNRENTPAQRVCGNILGTNSWHQVLKESGHYDNLFSQVSNRLKNMHGFYSPKEFKEQTGLPRLSNTFLIDYLTQWLKKHDIDVKITKKKKGGRGCSGYFVNQGSGYLRHALNKYQESIKEFDCEDTFSWYVRHGRDPTTLLALFRWAFDDDTSQREAAKMYNLSELSVRNQKQFIADQESVPEVLKDAFKTVGWGDALQ
jgi:hypothetical protein